MNTLEIDTLLQKHPNCRPVFKGVYDRNILPRLWNVPTALVGNTDPDHRMLQHWVAIYIDANSRGDYYDPTGRPPSLDLQIPFEYKKKVLSCADFIEYFTSFIDAQDIAWQMSPGS
jgi:hypothetical protein